MWSTAPDIGGKHGAGFVCACMNFIGNIGGIISPILMGMSFQYFQSFTPAIMITAAVTLTCAFLFLLLYRVPADRKVIETFTVAANRADRTSALVMISAPGPQWHLRPRHEWYARLPWLFGPVFLVEAPFRLGREVRAALPGWPARLKYLANQLTTLVSAPASVSRMASRARLIAPYDRVADSARVTAPTLIVQGDESLDHVTGSGGTAEYARLITGARLVRMPDTGHLGSVTQPRRCADLVRRFLIDTIKDTHHSAA